MPVDDAHLVKVAGRHFDVPPVAKGDADEIFAHLAGDVRENRVAIRQLDSKLRSGRHLPDMAGQFNRLFFGHGAAVVAGN